MCKKQIEQGGIYMWRCKVNNKCYIGKAADLKDRYYHFTAFHRSYSGKKINNARKKYNSLDFWEYEILEYCDDESKRRELEVFYIDKYNTLDKKYGYNTVRGDSSLNDRDAWIERYRVNWIPIIQYQYEDGKFVQVYNTFEEFKETEYNLEKVLNCCETNIKSSKPYLWRFKDYEGNIKLEIEPGSDTGIKVYQFDLYGNFIKEFSSAKEIERELSYPASCIRSSCSQKATSHGFYWLHKEDIDKIDSLIEYRNKTRSEKAREGYKKKDYYCIAQYDLDGNFIQTFEYKVDAMSKYNLHNLSLACRSNKKTDGGFIWKLIKSEKDIIPQYIDPSTYIKDLGYKFYQIDEVTEEIVAEYESIMDSERLTKNTYKLIFSTVAQCLRGITLQHKGFIFILKDEYSKEKVREIKLKLREQFEARYGRPVLQIDIKTGEILKKWRCASDAETAIAGKCYARIRGLLNGKKDQKTTLGFKWEYAPYDEDDVNSYLIQSYDTKNIPTNTKEVFTLEKILEKFKEYPSIKEFRKENKLMDNWLRRNHYKLTDYESEEQKEERIKNRHKIRAKAIECYDAEGNLVKEYNSIADAERDGFRHVSDVLNGRRKSVRKHYFKYKE